MNEQKNSQNGNYESCPLCGSQAVLEFVGTDLAYKKDKTYNYTRCTKCDALFQNPIPDKDDIAGFYPETYYAYKPPGKKPRSNVEKSVLRYRYGYEHLDVPTKYEFLARLIPRSRFRDAIPYVKGGRALDVGCGAGRYLSRLKEFGWQCEGVELTKAAVDAAREGGLSVFHGSLEEANFEDESFDVVHASHVIEHVDDPKVFMKEIARILKPGGRCIIRTPNSRALGQYIYKENWFPNEVPRHLIMFTRMNLIALAESNGLNVIESYFNTKSVHVLNSMDYVKNDSSIRSKKKFLNRALAKLFVWIAKITRKGDEIYAVFVKPFK